MSDVMAPVNPDETSHTSGSDSMQLWDDHADWWQAEFTDGVDPEYTDQILPLIAETVQGKRNVLDVGAGEGQVSRHLQSVGIPQVIAIDPIASQVELARRRGGPVLARAAADGLPFADGSFDAVVACLVFEHIDQVDEALSEVARVLESGGVFCFLLNHPLLQTPGSGWIDDQVLDPPEQYWRLGAYLNEAVTVEQVQKDVFIRFVHRPLSRYINALSRVGLMVDRMEEPAPPPAFVNQAPQYEAASTIPRLLALTCVKRTDLR